MMLALLGAFLLRDLFNSLRIRINNTFEQNVIYDMRREVYARLQRLPVELLRPARLGRPDDPGDRGRQLGRAGADRRHGARHRGGLSIVGRGGNPVSHQPARWPRSR